MLSAEDCDHCTIISSIIHPFTRYLKGVTEWIWQNKQHWSLDLMESFLGRCQLVFPDEHSVPIAQSYPDVIDKIIFVPSDIWSDQKTRIILMEIFQHLGHAEIILPIEDRRLHQSSPEKLAIFNRLKQLFLDRANSSLLLPYQIFSKDLYLYQQAVDKFSHQTI